MKPILYITEPGMTAIAVDPASREKQYRLALIVCSFLLLGIAPLQAQAGMQRVQGVLDVYTGTSPAGAALWQALGIAPAPAAELVQWELRLYRAMETGTGGDYYLRCDYGMSGANVPGIASGKKSLERNGIWKTSFGYAANPLAIVYELQNAVALYRADRTLLHILDTGRNLMVGDGGWSYTLNNAAYAEKSVEPELALNQPDRSYRISPKAAGPAVFGIFEGRTPIQGIANALGIPVNRASTKAKWRITLYKDPQSGLPAKFKAEGSLFLDGAHEGAWSVLQGTGQDPRAIVYYLAGSNGIAPIRLMKVDDNILYFLDQDLKWLVGNADFSYTLNRSMG